MAGQSQRPDRDHRLPLGARLRRRAGPRPARPLGARGGRARLSSSPARPGEAARICARAAVRAGPDLPRRHGPASSRPAPSSNISASRTRQLLPRDPQGRYPRHPVDLCRAQQRRAGAPAAGAVRHLLRRRGVGQAAPARAPRTSPGSSSSACPTGSATRSGSRTASPSATCSWSPCCATSGTPTSSPNSPTSPPTRRAAKPVPHSSRRWPTSSRSSQQQSTRRRSSMTYFEGFVAAVPEANKEPIASMRPKPRRSSRNSASSAMSRRGTATSPKARSPTSARRSTPSPTRRSCSPGSNIPTRRPAMPPTRRCAATRG